MAIKILNRYARYEYEILETYEGGIVLVGDEIKAIRSGRVNLKGSYGRLFYNNSKPEVFLVGAHFHTDTLDPYRTRKLLFKKDEIKKFIGKLQEKNLTLVPLTIYMKRGKAKVEIALSRGKKKYDKREVIKKRDLDREARVNLKGGIK
jgi:SsrA-binding protein